MLLGFKDRRRGPEAKERRWPVEAGQGQETASPLEPPEL